MAKYPHLTNAPITEAIIDIRISLPDESRSIFIERSNDLEVVDYPQKQEKQRAAFNIDLAKIQADAVSTYNGNWFTSATGLEIFQARPDGFTFSRLKPYQDWNDLKGKALKMWEIYKSLLEGAAISRIAVRYINRLDFPMPSILSEYLEAPPSKIPGAPEVLVNYFSRSGLYYEDIGAIANVTQAVEQANEKFMQFIFDIDVILENAYGIDDERIWNDLDKLREIKNMIFHKGLTTKAKELYQ